MRNNGSVRKSGSLAVGILVLLGASVLGEKGWGPASSQQPRIHEEREELSDCGCREVGPRRHAKRRPETFRGLTEAAFRTVLAIRYARRTRAPSLLGRHCLPTFRAT